MHSLGTRQMCGGTLWTVNMTKTAASIGRAVKGNGMHWICSGRLRTLEIAVERSGMSRARRIAADKPPDMLEVCEKIGEAPEGTKCPKNCEVKGSAGERR